MSKLQKIFLSICFVFSLCLITFAVIGATIKINLEGQNKALQATNKQLQGEIVALQQQVEKAEQKSARLARRANKLENTYWDQRSQISILQNRVRDLRRGLPFWEANYDMMVAQNLGHKYRDWPFDLREQLLGALGAMSQIGPEGHVAAIQRFASLRAQVESAVKAGVSYGWEKESLADFQAKL